MSGGQIAIKGFDYQATAILDQLFDHFDRHGSSARARPEAGDDLDLIWTEGGRDQHRYVQIKKPRETVQGQLKNTPWSLADVTGELLGSALGRLRGNESAQSWLLGDRVASTVWRLLGAGRDAPIGEPSLYWLTVHKLARAEAIDTMPLAVRKQLLCWRFKPTVGADAVDVRRHLIADFSHELGACGATADVTQAYGDRVASIDDHLPDALARIDVSEAYGAEDEVAHRVRERLERDYRLPEVVVRDSVFRNLRGFINDASKPPGIVFGRVEFEAQLRCAWPQMSVATDAPALLDDWVERPDLSDALTKRSAEKVVEAIGISGSGKTSLAAQSAARLKIHDPDRLAVYVRVRSDVAFRDVMAGTGFYLFQRGVQDLFGLAVESRPADEAVIVRLAEVCAGLSRPILLLLDLVDGRCDPQFGRDLAIFVRALEPGACRVAIFTQESAFAAMSPIERDGAGVRPMDMRGFRFEEFVKLVGRRHSDPDRALLRSIYDRVAAGRQAGLSAKLAEALARQPTLAAMDDVANQPSGNMLPAAEQRRFGELSASVRPAAERLVCFALPFRRRDAEAVFPRENVGAALKELLALGLLRAETDDRFEMHEQVRAGLEDGISPAVRQAAHVALAAWHGAQGELTAQMLHLTKAGRTDEADAIGRDAFLRGESWRALADYVTGRRLVRAEDVVKVIGRPEPVEDAYLLDSILCDLEDLAGPALLLDLLSDQTDRYFQDFNWARPVVEAILRLDPSQLQPLIEFSIKRARTPEQRRSALSWLAIAARRVRKPVQSPSAAFVSAEPQDVQEELTPFLFLDGGRAALRQAFAVLAKAGSDEDRRKKDFWWPARLQLDRDEDVVECLAALPIPLPASMSAARSVLFGPLEKMIWFRRDKLREPCAELLLKGAAEPAVKINALRTLIYLGDLRLEQLADPLRPNLVLQGLDLLAPLLAPAAYDEARYEARLFDLTAPVGERQAALQVLTHLGADLDALYARLMSLSHDPSPRAVWDLQFLLLCAVRSFASGVPLLAAQLAAPSSPPLPPQILVASLTMAAEAPWPDATALLLQALSYPDASVRRCAAGGLARRRARDALPSLKQFYATEADVVTATLLGQAIAASGPTDASDLQGRAEGVELQVWRSVVAMRTADTAFAPQLVSIATDKSSNWRLRRAAIFAASRLPYEGALQQIADRVLIERSPFKLDRSQFLHAHETLSNLLQGGIAYFLKDGRAAFISFVADIFERSWSQAMGRAGLPSPREAAIWLYHALTICPRPDRVQQLSDRLHVPLLQAAVVRGFRISGRPEQIEATLADASSVWLAARCLQERRWVGDDDPDLVPRLRRAVAQSPCRGDAYLDRIMDEIESGRALARSAPLAPPPAAPKPERPAPFILGFDEAIQVLHGAEINLDPAQTLALTPLSRVEMQRLIALADQANDPQSGQYRYTPIVEFRRDSHVVGRESWTSSGGPSSRDRLRPAIAAANRFALPMPWHEAHLRWPLINNYAPKFVASLGAQDDADRFYAALERDEDALIPYIGRIDGLEALDRFLDARLVPVLGRQLSRGDDVLFESLCMLVLRVKSEAAVPILSRLLQRWAGRFDLRSPNVQSGSTELWRGFTRLTEHARFSEVEGWRKTLEDVLLARVPWYHAQSVAKVLGQGRGSYVVIETRLLKEEPWVLASYSEIDRLDATAQRLFADA